jgi:hypothetical protein
MDKISRKLVQDVIFEDLPEACKILRFVEELATIHKCKQLHFPLIFDPVKEKKAAILGMFIVRPAYRASCGTINPIGQQADGLETPRSSLCAKAILVGKSWSFNYKGLDGGWFLSNKNVLDAYRVALHYGLSDAVIVGTRTVAVEGVDRRTAHGEQRGYLWQPYGPTEWPHLKAACPNLLELIMKQRSYIQEQGNLSHRKYPAQIVFTFSGKSHSSHVTTRNIESISDCSDQGGAPPADFLEARIFTEFHPTGEPIECYIMTGATGAAEVRKRVQMYYPHLIPRIENMLIILPPKSEPDICDAAGQKVACEGNERETGTERGEESVDVDLLQVPKILFERFGMRIVNHDGGRQILNAFCEAGEH